MKDLKPFQLGSTQLDNPFFLAPMDGFTDYPFRTICKRLGAGVLVSEFINGLDIENQHPFLQQKIYFSEDEHPFGYQIFDDSPERLLLAAQYLREFNPDFIDINFGCSARNVTNRGAGAGLLRNPSKIAAIISTLVKNVDLPITAKIRLGWDNHNLNYLEVSHIIESEGAQMIAVHARTKVQGYSGKADWDAIARIQEAISIPVIANGDIRTPDDIDKVLQETGSSGIMVGRGALSNPWIFQRKYLEDIQPIERYKVFQLHFEKMLSFYGKRIGLILFRKHLHSYINSEILTRPQRIELFTQTESSGLENLVKQYIYQNHFSPGLNSPF
ncbi:MAG: hypothetical protein BGO78_01800 [Chloroflexi bacterium 44-23]|nr:MAG: hypothetical protein BGO78_01800 [Chloroflexi bacterium 44-23]